MLLYIEGTNNKEIDQMYPQFQSAVFVLEGNKNLSLTCLNMVSYVLYIETPKIIDFPFGKLIVLGAQYLH